MTTEKEAKSIYREEMTRLAGKVAERVGVTPNAHGELPAVPQVLIQTEALRELLEKD